MHSQQRGQHLPAGLGSSCSPGVCFSGAGSHRSVLSCLSPAVLGRGSTASIRGAADNSQQQGTGLALEEKTSKYSVLNSNKARVHERSNFSYLFTIMQKQDLSATISESSLSCLLSKPQRAGKPQESAATSSQTAELLLSPGIRHCAVFTRRLKHL